MIISQTRNELEEILDALPESQKQSKLKPINLGAESPKEEDKPYSVENVRKLAYKKNISSKTANEAPPIFSLAFLQSFFSNPLNTTFVILTIAVFLGAIVGLTSDKKPIKVTNNKQIGNERNITKGRGSKIPTSFRMNKPCTLDGNVVNIISESSIVISHSGREIMVKFRGKEAQEIKKGDKVSVTCIPYRENPHGIILSNGTRISKI